MTCAQEKSAPAASVGGELEPVLAAVALFVTIFMGALVALHHAGLLLQQYDFDAPYQFEPRFAARCRAIQAVPPPDVVFTGDSRMEGGLDPQGLDCLPSFNLSSGSQTLPIVRLVILDTLDRLGVRPRFLCVGVTPDMLARSARDDGNTSYQLKMYRHAKRFGQEAPWLRRVQEEWLPVLFYREAALAELDRYSRPLTSPAPPLDFFGAPLRGPVTWREWLGLFEIPQTAWGFNPDGVGPYLTGAYPAKAQGVRPRLVDPYVPDEESLAALCADARARGIEPIFLVMPFHDTFWETHPRLILARVRAALARLATDHEVLVLDPAFPTGRADHYVDGHHLSLAGARALTAAVRHELCARKASGELETRWKRHCAGALGRRG